MRTLRNFVKNPLFDPAEYPVEAGAEYIHVAKETWRVDRPNGPPVIREGRYLRPAPRRHPV
jgi:hypothetical protein